jgi:hypothetical protein
LAATGNSVAHGPQLDTEQVGAFMTVSLHDGAVTKVAQSPQASAHRVESDTGAVPPSAP